MAVALAGATPFPPAAATDAHLHLRGGKAEAPPEHVLVCAPSNAAIDEIVARLLHTGPGGGLLDASGRHFVPPVLRVGPNIRESLSHVSLDSLARKRQMEAGDALTYEAARSLVLVEARIVCTTLSCAGHKDFASLRFDTVIIDEAAQAVEVSTLIPLKYACRRLILVGDPNQLPATVFSERSKEHNYEQSLFERLQKGRHAVTMLQTQYRMHPHISAFPSAHFYAGAIHDAPSVVSQPPRPWHARRCLAPYVFYDVADGHAEQSSSTWYNDLEAKLAVAIIEHLLTRHGESLSASSIGVITPYNGQVRHIRKLLADELGGTAAAVEVNSVDGFQGREKEFILFSCVRTRGLGFVRDRRRTNVSMTRALHSLLILGHADALREDALWAAVLDDASARRCLLKAHSRIRIWFNSPSRKALPPEAAPAAEKAAAAAGSQAAAAGRREARCRRRQARRRRGEQGRAGGGIIFASRVSRSGSSHLLHT